MILPPNLPAKGFITTNMKQFANVQPYRKDVSQDQIEAAKRRLMVREAQNVARIQANARERIAHIRAMRKRIAEQRKN